MKAEILVTGAGGFIGGHLVNFFYDSGYLVRAVDKKPLFEWRQLNRKTENLCLDLYNVDSCKKAVKGITEVYNLAANMGGLGFLENNRVECLRNIFINANMIDEASKAGVERYFFSSSSCVYNQNLQKDPNAIALKESDAYPALAERGYGWEKLMSEMFCQEYLAERGLKTFIARFHNVYGPHETWKGGKEKVPAATCRKVAQAKLSGKHEIEIWGDGTRTRSFTFVDDCIVGINKIVHKDVLAGVPINLGSSEMVSINELVSIVEEVADIKLKRNYKLDAPQGVVGRNSDNTFIKDVLGWEPKISLRDGIRETYLWIEDQLL